MDELRDKVVELVRFSGYPSDDVAAHMHDEAAERTADSILALPEIAEALTKAKRWDEACMDALDD